MEKNSLDKKYTDYISNMLEQIQKLIPKDINKLQTGYLKNNLKKVMEFLAQSMQEDADFSKLDIETKCTYLQIMTEWCFHKEIDLFRSGIPPKYWKHIMQKIISSMWDVLRACVNNKADEEVLLDVIEKYVDKAYLEAIEELKKTNEIDIETEKRAKIQSNIKLMAEEILRHKHIIKLIKRGLFLLFLGVTIGLAVSFIVFKFKMTGVVIVLTAAVVLNIFILMNNNDKN